MTTKPKPEQHYSNICLHGDGRLSVVFPVQCKIKKRNKQQWDNITEYKINPRKESIQINFILLNTLNMQY